MSTPTTEAPTVTTEQAHQAPALQPSTTPAAPEAAPTGNTPETPTAVTTDDGTTWTLEEAVREIGKLRKENGAERVNAKQTAAEEARNEFATKIAEALGIQQGEVETVPTVEALSTQVQEATTAREQAETDARTARVELAVYKAASTVGADPTALLDSRTFTDSLADVDPTDSEAIQAAITKAVETNPRLKTTQVVGASSVEHPGGSGEGAITPERFRSMSGAERNELYRTDPTTYARLTGRA